MIATNLKTSMRSDMIATQLVLPHHEQQVLSAMRLDCHLLSMQPFVEIIPGHAHPPNKVGEFVKCAFVKQVWNSIWIYHHW